MAWLLVRGAGAADGRAPGRDLPSVLQPRRAARRAQPARRRGDARGRRGRARRPAAPRSGVRAADAAAGGDGALSARALPDWPARPAQIRASCCRLPVVWNARSSGCRTSPGCGSAACARASPVGRSASPICAPCGSGSRTRVSISARPWPSWTSSCAGSQKVAGLREPRARRAEEGEAAQPA